MLKNIRTLSLKKKQCPIGENYGKMTDKGIFYEKQNSVKVGRAPLEARHVQAEARQPFAAT